MGVQLWPGHKIAVFTTEDAVLSATEKSAPNSQQEQVNADFVWHSRNCAHGVCSTWSDCQWEFLLRGFESTEGKCEAQTAWDVEERRLLVAPWQRACTHLVRCVEERRLLVAPWQRACTHLARCVEERRLLVAPWQRACTHLARCEGIPGK